MTALPSFTHPPSSTFETHQTNFAVVRSASVGVSRPDGAAPTAPSRCVTLNRRHFSLGWLQPKIGAEQLVPGLEGCRK